MFDLIVGTTERPLRERSPMSKAVALGVHIVVITLVVAIPLLRATNVLPDVPTMMAFVAPSAAPPPPPPPPAPPPVETAKPVTPAEPAKSAGPAAAPTEAPSEIRAEPPRPATTAGVEGGVEGGIAGGVSGGIVGGLTSAAPPPPPPPPPPPQAPLRVGGQITAPALLTRVEPVYPDLARIAQVGGMVILEAVVGIDGCVDTVTVLRSPHPLLAKAATEALKRWRYSPLVLNDTPTRFVLTVTFNFSVVK